MKNMRVAVLEETGRIRLHSRPVPSYGPNDVLVRVAYVGVCGSDMALFENGFIGHNYVREPMVLGHEASGTVVAVGDLVRDSEPGDRVALEPGVPCGKCDLCRRGLYNLCPDVFFWASLPVTEGAVQDYVRHPAKYCHKLPNNLSLLDGALVEPLSVGLHAVEKSDIKAGQNALVLGFGCIGALTTLSLLAAGVPRVIAVDLMENRLNLAGDIGAEPLLPAEGASLAGTVESIFGKKPQHVFEAAGNETTMNEAISCCERGGTITFVGYTKKGIASIEVNDLIDKELTIKSVFRYRHIYPRAISLLSRNYISLEKIVSSVFELEDIQAGFEAAVNRKSEVTKCVVSVNGER